MELKIMLETMRTKTRDVSVVKLRYNRLINNSCSFLEMDDRLDGYEISDLTSCLIMIYKEVRELIVGEFLNDSYLDKSLYIMQETVEYMFSTADDISSYFTNFNLSHDILLEIVGTIEMVIEYATKMEEFEVAYNLSNFNKKFLQKNYNNCG